MFTLFILYIRRNIGKWVCKYYSLFTFSFQKRYSVYPIERVQRSWKKRSLNWNPSGQRRPRHLRLRDRISISPKEILGNSELLPGIPGRRALVQGFRPGFFTFPLWRQTESVPGVFSQGNPFSGKNSIFNNFLSHSNQGRCQFRFHFHSRFSVLSTITSNPGQLIFIFYAPSKNKPP